MSQTNEAKVMPSIGDNVLLHLNGSICMQAPLEINNPGLPMAANVAYVWGVAMVNLNVIDHNGKSHGLTSVKFIQPGDDAPASGAYCELDVILGELAEFETTLTADSTGTEGIVAADPDRVMSFGEKAVGLRFNPSNQTAVYQCKSRFAELIDQLDTRRHTDSDPEVKRLCSIAITEAQTAQMWAVKALTWES